MLHPVFRRRGTAAAPETPFRTYRSSRRRPRLAVAARPKQPQLRGDRVEKILEVIRRHRRHPAVELRLDPPDLGRRIDRLRRQPAAEFGDRLLPFLSVKQIRLAGEFAALIVRERVGGGSSRPAGDGLGPTARRQAPCPRRRRSTSSGRPFRPATGDLDATRSSGHPFFCTRIQVDRAGWPSSPSIASGSVRHAQRSPPSYV